LKQKPIKHSKQRKITKSIEKEKKQLKTTKILKKGKALKSYINFLANDFKPFIFYLTKNEYKIVKNTEGGAFIYYFPCFEKE